MIRLVLEDDATVLTTVWRLRVKGACIAFSGHLDTDEYPSKEAAEDRLRGVGRSQSGVRRTDDDRWLDWMEAYEVTVARGSVSRTEVMTWPAREDFDAWVARVRSGTKRKKRQPRIAKEHAIAMDGPTSASSVLSGMSEEEASGFVSENELLVKASLAARKDTFRAMVLEAMARAARKRASAEAGMDWEMKP